MLYDDFAQKNTLVVVCHQVTHFSVVSKNKC